MTSITRGPLPARVYWVRRTLVFGFALLLVVGIARVLDGGSDGSSAPDQATQVAAEPTAQQSRSPEVRPTKKNKQPGKDKSSQAPPLAQPSGACDDADVAVTPEITNGVAVRDVLIVLRVRTLVSEACTWRISPTHVTIKITSGNDDIWSSRQCPRAIAVRDVVVRRDVTTTVGLTWNARRSDDDCSRLTPWALPGFYHVAAAALGGEPSDVQFKLATPTAAVITKTAQPTQEPEPQGNGGKNKHQNENQNRNRN